MEEVSGPVVAIALILAAVFVPTAFIPGITGQLYKQFAVTIAISVLFSAFNALTLSPALSAIILRSRESNARSAGRILSMVQQSVRQGDRWLRGLVLAPDSQGRIAFMLLGSRSVRGRILRQTSYQEASCRMKIRATSTRATVAGCLVAAAIFRGGRKVEKVDHGDAGRRKGQLRHGIQHAERSQSTYSSFFFISLKPWEERKTPETSYIGIKAHSKALVPEFLRDRVFVPAAGYSWCGNIGRRDFHPGGSVGQGIEFLAKIRKCSWLKRANVRNWQA